MSEWKADLLTLTKNCDLEGVQNFLKERPTYDINTKDHRGVTALHLAVRLNCGSIVRFLLDNPKIKIGDAALLAIAENNLELAVLLLDRIKKSNAQAEFKGVEGSSGYPPYMTPLMLAALYGHYNMIKILIRRNHKLEKPHDMYCTCDDCKKMAKDDQLVVVDRRIALLKSISNPAYICITSKDPILTALRLFKDLQNWSKFDSPSAREYETIARSVARFSSELMDETNTTREVDIILKRKEGWVYSGKTTYPRLTMAMIYENKDFVGNIHVQQVLENSWYGNFSWKKCGIFEKVWRICIRVPCIPLVSIMSVITPKNHWVVSQLEIPVLLFIDRTITFVCFLAIIFWENSINRKTMGRGFPTTYAEPLVILFTCGFIWRTLRLLMLQGIARYFRFHWNLWEFFMQIFLVITISFWIVAFVLYGMGDTRDKVPRKEWHSCEPILIAESSLVFATFMAFIKILFIFQLHPVLGPLQMSLSSMLKDCFKFLTIFLIFMVAFGAGINNLYSYYRGMKYKDDSSEEVQQDTFMSFWHTLKTLYWSLFGLSERTSGELVIDNGNEHIITEATGYILFTVFVFTMIIIVINMLIASLTNAYQRVIDNNIDEWSYGKTEVYLSHMDGLLVLPVPFNLLFEWVNDLRRFVRDLRDKRKRWHCTFLHGCFMIEENPIEDETEYLVLMSQLRSRYFLKNCKLFRLGVPEISDDFCADDDD